MIDRAVRWVMALAAMWAVASCGLVDDTPTYRYRLTVEVETPEGLRAGSSVIEVDTQQATFSLNPSATTIRFRVRGEAVAVDLPGDRTVFALLRSANDADWAGRVMLMAATKPSDDAPAKFDDWFDIRQKRSGRITLPRVWPLMGHLADRSAYPTLVTFGDLADPISVELVDPDNLAASFGEGVRLKRITVQVTSDPVTTGVAKRLEWLANPQVMENPGWSELPGDARQLIIGLGEGQVGAYKD